MPTEPPPPDAAAALRTYLQGRHVPCPSCGFDLVNLTVPTCPECGRPLAIGVHLPAPPRSATLGTVLLSAGTGACALIIATCLLQSATTLASGRPQLVLDLDTEHTLIAGPALAAFAIALLAWLLPPTRLIRRGVAVRSTITAAAAAGLLLLTVLFSLLG